MRGVRGRDLVDRPVAPEKVRPQVVAAANVENGPTGRRRRLGDGDVIKGRPVPAGGVDVVATAVVDLGPDRRAVLP